MGSGEHRGAHAYEHMVLDDAAVDIGPMAHGNIVTDDAGLVICYVEAGEVLDVAALADLDVAHIPPGHHAGPQGGIFPHPHIP